MEECPKDQSFAEASRTKGAGFIRDRLMYVVRCGSSTDSSSSLDTFESLEDSERAST